MGERREREKKERSDQGEGEGGRGIIKWARQRERESGSSYYGGVRSGDFTSRLLRYSVPDQYVKLGLPPPSLLGLWADEDTSSSSKDYYYY